MEGVEINSLAGAACYISTDKVQEQQLQLQLALKSATKILRLSFKANSLAPMALLKKGPMALFLAAIVAFSMIISSCHAADGSN
jgi:hypothetical protein